MTVEATTANGYRWIVERYVRLTFGDREVASVRTLELDHWYQQLPGRWGSGRPGATRPAVRTVEGDQAVMHDEPTGAVAVNTARPHFR